MLLLLASFAFAHEDEVKEPLPVEDAVAIDPEKSEQLILVGRAGGMYWLNPVDGNPLYVLSTPTFDRFLADTEKLNLCEESRENLTGALAEAKEGLTSCDDQFTVEDEADEVVLAEIDALQNKLGRRTSERNLALGGAIGLAAALVVYGLTSR